MGWMADPDAVKSRFIRRGKKWWARQDSNLRPSGYEPPALPLSYEPMERETRLELATTCLEGRDSTN